MASRFRPLTRDQIHADFWRAKRALEKRYLAKPARPSEAQARLYSASLRREQNIFAVGVGRKETGGKGTAHYAVRLYVRRKLPLSTLGKHRIPEHLNGIATDVIETEPFRALASTADATRQRVRPLHAGTSIGFSDGDQLVAGTLTAIVQRDGRLFALSNNHVLAFENRLAIGADIIQPASLDGGQDPADRIGTLAQFIPLGAGNNAVDAAIAALDADIGAPDFTQPIALASNRSVTSREGMLVTKVGRGTGLTQGAIKDLGISAQVDFETGQFTFTDQLLIVSSDAPFAAVGDSGALVTTAGARPQPVAMLFAGQPQYALATPIDRVLAALGVDMAT